MINYFDKDCRITSRGLIYSSGYIYASFTGCAWRRLPICFGNYNTCFKWLSRHLPSIVEIAKSITCKPHVDRLYVDTTYLKVNVNCNRNIGSESIGISRAGKTTKVSIVTDSFGGIFDVHVGPGNAADITIFKEFHLQTIHEYKPKVVIADAAYVSSTIFNSLAAKSILYLPKPRRNSQSYEVFQQMSGEFKSRNIIERVFGKMKRYSRIPLRRDKMKSLKNLIYVVGFIRYNSYNKRSVNTI